MPDVGELVEVTDRIKLAFLTLVEQQMGDVLASTFDHEPETLGDRPCLTMLIENVEPRDVATGPAEDVVWSWEVRLYCDLRNYRDGQRELERLLPRLLNVTRDDRHLGLADEVIESSITDRGETPEFNHDQGLLWKVVRLNVKTEET